RKTPYELGKDLFGDPSAAAATLDLTSKERIRNTIVERLRAENDR
ncbi:MAG TPA: CopG family transcriptional regulator, partial [Rhodocyclaceae bacterium]|nr:CopG family transcriptional regulator [Rhodocyclaceae bacterium]